MCNGESLAETKFFASAYALDFPEIYSKPANKYSPNIPALRTNCQRFGRTLRCNCDGDGSEKEHIGSIGNGTISRRSCRASSLDSATL
jgi:hypothetical protein